MKVKDIMTKELILLQEKDSIAKATELFINCECDGIPVVNQKQKLKGLITKSHILQAVNDDLDLSISVASIMTKDLNTLDPEDDISLLPDLFTGCLPVLNRNKLVGMVSKSDIIWGYSHYIKQLSIQFDMVLSIIPNLVQSMDHSAGSQAVYNRKENSNIYNHTFDQSFHLEFLNVVEKVVDMAPLSTVQHKGPINRLRPGKYAVDTKYLDIDPLKQAIDGLESDILVHAYQKFGTAPRWKQNLHSTQSTVVRKMSR